MDQLGWPYDSLDCLLYVMIKGEKIWLSQIKEETQKKHYDHTTIKQQVAMSVIVYS